MGKLQDAIQWGDGTPVAVGWDQSVNHAAVVALDGTGAIVALWALCTRAGDAQALGDAGARLPRDVLATGKLDPAVRDLRRLLCLRAWIGHVVGELRGMQDHAHDPGAIHVALEDYAYAAGHEAYGTGQVGGVLRCAIMDAPFRLRLHDPTAVKLWATGRGNADKDDVRDAVRDAYGVDFSALGLSTTASTDATAGDLADAYVLARMALGEVDVRAGRRTLQDLTDGERRVFLRVTKTHPSNLLDRPWGTAQG